MCGGSPKAPPPPPKLPETPRLPETTGDTSAAGIDARRRRAAGGQSRGGTILTSSQGVTTPGATATKTLLGQ